MIDLFRPEVLAAQRGSWLGPVAIVQPLRFWLLGTVALIVATVFVAFLFLGEYSRRSRVTGQLVPSLGLATLVAPTDGVVAQHFADEGTEVAAGAPLLRIQHHRATAGGRDALGAVREHLETRDASVRNLDASEARKVFVQKQGLRAQLASAEQELAQMEKAIAIKRELVRLSEATQSRFHQLGNLQYVSQSEVEQREQTLLILRGEQQELERLATGLQRGRAQIQQQLRELPAQRASQQASTARERALLGEERVRHDASEEFVLQAPLAGLVASRLVEPGQAVRAGQPLLSLLPAGSALQAQLLAPSRAVGFIEPGDRVLLRYQAFPYQKFGHHGGHVVNISRSAINPGEAAALAGQGQVIEPYYRVLVTLDRQTVAAYGKPEALRPGMTLDADIVGERRKLYEWLLEPLYSLRGIDSRE